MGLVKEEISYDQTKHKSATQRVSLDLIRSREREVRGAKEGLGLSILWINENINKCMRGYTRLETASFWGTADF